MHVTKKLAEQNIDALVGGQLQFRLVGLPGGMDVLSMKLYGILEVERSVAHGGAATLANFADLFSRIELEAYGEPLIKPVSYMPLLIANFLEGSGPQNDGLGEEVAGITPFTRGIDVVHCFTDGRQDEKGSAYDTAQDSTLLNQGGVLTVTVAPQAWDVESATLHVGAEFILMPRAGVYARPYKVFRKMHQRTVNGAPLDRGVFFDIFATGNAAGELAAGLGGDIGALTYAEYGGLAFVDNIRTWEIINHWLSRSRNGGQAGTIISNYWLSKYGLKAPDLALIHTQFDEYSEISKARRSPNAEGLVTFTPGTTAGGNKPFTATELDIYYMEIKPAGRDHVLRVAQSYGIGPDAALATLGPDSDPWMPKQLRA